MILLTFNIINNPSDFKKNHPLEEADTLNITVGNVSAILRILENHNIRATFFVAVSLINKTLPLIKKIVSKSHEISLYNDSVTLQEIETAKRIAEESIEKIIRGIRQKDVRIPVEDLKKLEFSYISNIETANIFFPLKRLERTTQITVERGLSIIPEGISPYTQIPYNDLAFQIIPTKLYRQMISETLENNDFMMIYLSSWQFADSAAHGYKIPFYRRYNSGRKLEDKLSDFLNWLNKKELACARIKDFIV